MTAAPGPRPGSPWRRRWLHAALAVPVLVLLWERGQVHFGENFHAVVPGRVYRCAQLSGAELERRVRAHGIRTVVNLRGCCAPQAWYLDECRATHRLNVAQEDVALSAGRYPSAHEMRRLVAVLDHSEYPLLLHCRQGADRTGLAAVLVRLLEPGTDWDTARRQLSLRYGHAAVSRPANLDRYLGLYAGWLSAAGRPHSPGALRAWLARDDCPGETCSAVEALDVPGRLRRDEPAALRVRAHNRGLSPWRLGPGTNEGVHVSYRLYDGEDRCLVTGSAGLFPGAVPPGGSIDLTVAVPALPVPGRYRLLVDMVEEPHCFFFQVGSEPLEREIVVD